MVAQLNSNSMEFLLENGYGGYSTGSYFYPAQGSAVTSLETMFFVCPDNVAYGLVAKIYLTFDTNVTAAPTDFQTFSFTTRKGADGTSISTNAAGTFATTSAATAFKPVDVTGTGTVTLHAGDVLSFKNAKSGAGAATPAAYIQLRFVPQPVMN